MGDLHEVAAKLYKDPAGAVLALRQITAILEVAKATYAALFKNSTHFTSEQHARHAILTIEQQQAEIADTLELLATGEEPDVRRENEKAAARKAKKAAIEGYSVVRKGKIRKRDKLYSAEQTALVDAPVQVIGCEVGIFAAEEIYRKRSGN